MSDTRVFPIDAGSVSKAARMVRAGGLVVFPTDTVYGLGCAPFGAEPLRRLFEAKGRGAMPIPVICDGIASASTVVDLSGEALKLAGMHWPGALTIVAPGARSVPFLLDQGSGMTGVRVPADGWCLRLANLCGGFITGTSANRSGEPPCRSAAESLEALGGKVDMILDGGRRTGAESTVVRMAPGGAEVLRQGSVKVLRATR